jgi:hypothetical protein
MGKNIGVNFVILIKLTAFNRTVNASLPGRARKAKKTEENKR